MSIKALGELALRVKDLENMKTFYRDVVGLELFSDGGYFAFFKIAEAVDGHPQILGLFDRDADFGEERTRLDHFAFLIDLADYEEQQHRLEALGLDIVRRTFPNFHWRSLFFSDPEGNRVEFVSYDPTV
jgi:predicted enzyme related to lactoylglutathione lyase